MKHGKKYVESQKLIDSTALYDTAEAIDSILHPVMDKIDVMRGPRDFESARLMMQRRAVLNISYRHLPIWQ